MTIEEFKTEYSKYNNVGYLTDKIYDDFGSRLCSNCKFYNKFNECELLSEDSLLRFKDMDYSVMRQETPKDFGCNRWVNR